MKKTISLILVLTLGLAAEVANADFTFGEPTNLGTPINSSYDECAPYISADGLSLYFGEYLNNRPDGYGGMDIWLSTRDTVDDGWGTPVNLGPPINTSADDGPTSLSANGLVLSFSSKRSGGYGDWDIWVATRATTDESWGEPSNLGPTVNSEYGDFCPSLSADGLSLYFGEGYKFRPEGLGDGDLWVTTRAIVSEPWGPPENLGAMVNSSSLDMAPSISSDGRTLFFQSRRSGGEIWMTTRAMSEDDWAPAVNPGPPINTSVSDCNPNISPDGSTLYFSSNREGGQGGWDLYQTPILPVVDLNGDGIVDCADMCIMVDHWGTDEPLCDIGPTPFGDGIVDVQDLIVLAGHLFEGVPPVEPEEVNVDEEDDGSQVELEQGQILVVTLESNPTTGYRWEVVETQESILEQMGEAEFKPSQTGEPPLVGAGGWEIFRFEAISAGQMTLKLGYQRPWEEGVAPVKTFSIQVVVR